MCFRAQTHFDIDVRFSFFQEHLDRACASGGASPHQSCEPAQHTAANSHPGFHLTLEALQCSVCCERTLSCRGFRHRLCFAGAWSRYQPMRCVCGFIVGHCRVECAPTPDIDRVVFCSNLVTPKQHHASHPQNLIVSGGAHKGSREAVAVANSVCEGPGLRARIRTACAHAFPFGKNHEQKHMRGRTR